MVRCTRALLLLIIYVKLKAIWIELRTPVCHIFPCTVCRVEYILSERVVRAVRAAEQCGLPPHFMCSISIFSEIFHPGLGGAGAAQEPHWAINRRQEVSRGG